MSAAGLISLLLSLLSCPSPAGFQRGGQSDGASGGSAISPNGWLFNICLEKRRCVVEPIPSLMGIAQW